MRNYADRCNLHARIHALRGRLLTLRDYALLVKGEAPDFSRVSDAQEPARDGQVLFREQIAPLIGLVTAYERYTPLFLAFLRHYEAQNAKALLANTFGKQGLSHWYDISPFAILDEEVLRKKLSLEEVKSLLAATYLAHDLKDTSSYPQMVIRVEISTALNLYRASLLLPARAQKEFQDVMLKRIAMLTVIWSRRLREYYHWSDESILLYMEDLHDRFGGHAWSRVKVEERALNSYLEPLYKSRGKGPSVVDIERHLDRKFYAWVSSMFHRDFHSLYCVAAYLWLLFYQIKNLFCIIDGKRFNFSPDEILGRIICET
ncbi:MAG: V0D/AC39 family V-type ATPase subunit [Syntrophobacteraceae bacterium]